MCPRGLFTTYDLSFLWLSSEEFGDSMTTDTPETPVLFDKWSFQHLTGGVVVGSWGIFNVWQYFLLHSLFELWENTVGIVDWRTWGWESYRGDSWLNIIGDCISGVTGFYVMDKILDGKRASTPVLISLLGLGALVFYNHPNPVDQDFFDEKVRKALMTAGIIGVAGIIGYAAFQKERFI